VTKFNVNFSPHVYRLVGEMAVEREQTMADVIRDAISLAAWVDDELRQKNRILIDRGGVVTELLLPHAGRLQPSRPTLPDPDGLGAPAPADPHEQAPVAASRESTPVRRRPVLRSAPSG